jgi:hypothetical protein
MAYSIALYTGDGSTTQFSVTFPFIDRLHVTVLVNGASVPFVWLNDSLVALVTAPVNGASVSIQRDSSRSARVVDFQDAQVLTEKDLDLSALQTFYMAQEAFDNSDIATVSGSIAASVAAAAASASSAATSSTSAANSASAASTSAGAAATSAANAAASAASITGKLDNAAENIVSSTVFGIRAVPNNDYTIPSAAFSLGGTISEAASFWLGYTGAVFPTVPANKQLDIIRNDFGVNLAASSSVAQAIRNDIQAATGPVGSTAYGYRGFSQNLSQGNIFGIYQEADGGGLAGGPAYGLKVKTTNANMGGAGITCEVDTTVAKAFVVQDTSGGAKLTVDPSGNLTSVGYLRAAGMWFNAKWYGAVGNDATDDTAALNTAIAAVIANGGGVLYIPKGTYKITTVLSTLTGSSVMVVGDGEGATKIKQYTANAGVFVNTGGSNHIERLSITYSPTAVAGATAIAFGGNNSIVRDVTIDKAFIGLSFAGGVANRASNFQSTNHVSVGILFQTSSDCSVDHFVLNAGNATNAALGNVRMVDTCEAIYLTNGDVLNGVYPLTTTASVFSNGTRPAYCQFTNIFFDSAAQGAQLDKIVQSEFIGCWFSNGRSGTGNNGADLLTVDSLKFTNCRFFACGWHGVNVTAAALRTLFVNCTAESNSQTVASVGSGFAFAANTTDFTVIGCIGRNGMYPGGNQRWGIVIAAGTSDRYVIKDNLLSGNTTGNLSDGGTGLVKDVSELADNRIRGDFSNATDSSRKMFQTTVANSNSFVGVIPSGTALNGIFQAYNASDPNNASWLRIQAGNGACDIQSSKNGTGVAQILRLLVNGVVGAQLDLNANFVHSKARADISYSYQVPTTGFAITIADNSSTLILDPAGTLATGTITFPANPIDGQQLVIMSTQTVTALTINGNSKTVKNAPSTIAANGALEWRYRSTGTTWFRKQ